MTTPDKDLDWLRDEVVTLFEDAKGRDEPDHTVCVKYVQVLMELLPGHRGSDTRDNHHPDASLIEQVRLAVQQSTHPVPKSQTEP